MELFGKVSDSASNTEGAQREATSHMQFSQVDEVVRKEFESANQNK